MVERIDQHAWGEQKVRFLLSVDDRVESSDKALDAPAVTLRDLTLWDCHSRDNGLLCLASTLISGVALALRRAATQDATRIICSRRVLTCSFDQPR